MKMVGIIIIIIILIIMKLLIITIKIFKTETIKEIVAIKIK